jgi:hypothetical protein
MVKRVIRIVLMVLGGVALGVLVAFLFGWVVMLLWNWLMPAIFGLPTIGFWKAWGLVILAHILFKAGHYGPSHNKHSHPHPPWKEKFKEKMKRHFGERPVTPSAAEETDAR